MSEFTDDFDESSDANESVDTQLWFSDDDSNEKSPSLYLASVDESEVAQMVTQLPPHAGLRAVMDRTVRLELLLGDKDGQIADLTRDIKSELFLLVMEIRKDPSQFIMSFLSTMSEEAQATFIVKMLDLLAGRLEALNPLEVDSAK